MQIGQVKPFCRGFACMWVIWILKHCVDFLTGGYRFQVSLHLLQIIKSDEEITADNMSVFYC